MKRTTTKAAAQTASDREHVEAYLDTLEEPSRSTLKFLRADLKKLLPPAATEAIRYGMPCFRLNKSLIGYAAFKDHCSIFPMSGSMVRAMQVELEGYETSTGTIRFPGHKRFPLALLRRIIDLRLAEAGHLPEPDDQ